MTAVADNKKRVTIRTAQPGDRFDVRLGDGGKVILTPLLPAEKRRRIRLVKKHGFTVATGGPAITQEQVRKLLDEFP